MSTMIEEQERSAWLYSLKVGDVVAIRTGDRYGARFKSGRVVRRTATQIIGDDGNRYRADRGSRVGSGWAPRLEVLTDEIRADIRKSDERERFKSLAYLFDRGKLDHDSVRAMLKGLDDFDKFRHAGADAQP